MFGYFSWLRVCSQNRFLRAAKLFKHLNALFVHMGQRRGGTPPPASGVQQKKQVNFNLMQPASWTKKGRAILAKKGTKIDIRLFRLSTWKAENRRKYAIGLLLGSNRLKKAIPSEGMRKTIIPVVVDAYAKRGPLYKEELVQGVLEYFNKLEDRQTPKL
ncbi:MAG: hypothetical protein V1494_03960 [Candidatus Diapherotrites archaeon]